MGLLTVSLTLDSSENNTTNYNIISLVNFVWYIGRDKSFEMYTCIE